LRSTDTEYLTESKKLFKNRRDAGQKLAAELTGFSGQKTVVLAIPNGGIPLAIEVADDLKAELDIVVCRKIALPMNPEGGLGAVADDGTSILNQYIISRDGINEEQLEYEINQVKTSIKQRCLKYRGEILPPRLNGKAAIIVDDGLASGITMTVAIESVKHRFPQELVVAVPVASNTGYNRIKSTGNRVVTCAIATMPRFYLADFYLSWRDISDDEIVLSLENWRKRHSLF